MNRQRQRDKWPSKAELRAGRGHSMHRHLSDPSLIASKLLTVRRLIKPTPGDIFDSAYLRELDTDDRIVRNYFKGSFEFGIAMLRKSDAREAAEKLSSIANGNAIIADSLGKNNRQLKISMTKVGIFNDGSNNCSNTFVALYPSPECADHLKKENILLLGGLGLTETVAFDPHVTLYRATSYSSALNVAREIRQNIDLTRTLVACRATTKALDPGNVQI